MTDYVPDTVINTHSILMNPVAEQGTATVFINKFCILMKNLTAF